jgi:hypothetical protein
MLGVIALAALTFDLAVLSFGYPVLRAIAVLTWLAAGMLWFILLRNNSRR